jgi:hypothetical protein
MPPPSFKLAPLPMLIWAIWPQVTVAAEVRAVLLPADTGQPLVVQARQRRVLMHGEHGLQTVGLSLPQTASRTRGINTKTVRGDQPLAASSRQGGDQEAAAPAAPFPVMMPQPLVAVASLAVPTSTPNSTPLAPQSESAQPAKPVRGPQAAPVARGPDQFQPLSTDFSRSPASGAQTYHAHQLAAAFQETPHSPAITAPPPQKPQGPAFPPGASTTADIPRFRSGAATLPAFADSRGAGRKSTAEFQQANPIPMSPPSVMAPLRGPWWIPFPQDASAIAAPSRMAATTMPSVAAQSPLRGSIPVPLQMGLTPLSAASREAEMLMRASGRWWLPPDRVVVMPPSLAPAITAVAEPQPPTAPVNKPPIRISLPTLSAEARRISPVEPLHTIPLSSASAKAPSIGRPVTGLPQTASAGARDNLPAEKTPPRPRTEASAVVPGSGRPVRVVPKAVPVLPSEKLPSKQVEGSPIKEEPATAPVSGLPVRILPKTVPVATGEKLPNKKVDTRPVKEELATAPVSGLPVRILPKTVPAAADEKLPAKQAEPSLVKAASATAAVPEMTSKKLETAAVAAPPRPAASANSACGDYRGREIAQIQAGPAAQGGRRDSASA